MALLLKTLYNNSLLDLSGNGRDGTLTPGTSNGFVTTGIGQGALGFDGLTTKVVFTGIPSTTNLTISFVYKLRTLTSGTEFSIISCTSSGGPSITLFTDNKFYITKEVGTRTAIQTTAETLDNKFHHALITYNSASTYPVVFYRDGILERSTATTTAFTQNITQLGCYSDSSNPAKIILQNVKIWNQILTTNEIQRDYQEFVTLKQSGRIVTPNRSFSIPDSVSAKQNGLVASYNMSNVDGTLIDISGNNNNGTITNTTNATGIKGNALDFISPTSPSRVELGSGIIGTGNVTVSCFVKVRTSGTSDTGRILDNGSFFIQTNASGVFKVSNDNIGSVVSSAQWIANQWLHLLVTRDVGGVSTIYVNNVSVGSGQARISSPVTKTIIGNLNSGTNAFDGIIDSLKIWNRILTAQEITNEYNKFAKTCVFEEDFSSANASGVVTVPNSWESISGTYKVSALTARIDNPKMEKGVKTLQCVTPGVIAIPSINSYGTWEFSLNRGNNGNAPVVAFLSNSNAIASYNGYRFNITAEANGVGTLSSVDSGTASTMITGGTFLASTWYRFRITRNTSGLFIVYALGGIYTSWTSIMSATNTTYTTSNFIMCDFDATTTGDQITNIKVYVGI